MNHVKKFLSIFMSLTLLASSYNLAYAKKASPLLPNDPQTVSTQKDISKETPPDKKTATSVTDKRGFFGDVDNFYNYFRNYFVISMVMRSFCLIDPHIAAVLVCLWELGNSIFISYFLI